MRHTRRCKPIVMAKAFYLSERPRARPSMDDVGARRHFLRDVGHRDDAVATSLYHSVVALCYTGAS
ncbi:MAG: hypothetical protein IPM54_25775 [Polyangiaceae bacterium]|nr:hypothetical protein [Polyangiaceae bacterium]